MQEGRQTLISKIECKPSKEEIEGKSNFEGNWSELFLARVNNKTIRQQLINLLLEDERARCEYFSQKFQSDSETSPNQLKDSAGLLVFRAEVETFIPKSKMQIKRQLSRAISKCMLYTPIAFDDSVPSTCAISINWKNPHTGDILTIRQKSLVAAHEDGHRIRPLNYLSSKYFQGAFDTSKVNISKEDMLRGKPKLDKTIEQITPAEFRDFCTEIIRYLTTPAEIVERMSQLKNYFGMQGAELFTDDHLRYAKEHYVKDVGFDNLMTHFFQMITPQTEAKFLEFMNKCGI